MKNTVDDYKITIGWSAPDKCFVARFPAFPGVMADGPTPEAALAAGRAALAVSLDVIYKYGDEVPEPDAMELACV